MSYHPMTYHKDVVILKYTINYVCCFRIYLSPISLCDHTLK